MVWDAIREEMVLYGGFGIQSGHQADADSFYLAGTWVWPWATKEWEMLSPGMEPGPRRQAAATFHAGRGTVVIYGGLDPDGTPLDDFWEWNGTTWSPISGSEPGPPVCFRTRPMTPPVIDS